MAKKITIFFLFVLVALGTFLAGYLFSRNSNQNQPALIDNSLINRFQTPSEKPAPPVSPNAVSEGNVSQESFIVGNNVFYYNPKTGEVRSAPADGSGNSVLVSKIQPGATHISWASNKTLIATYINGSVYYDLSSGFSKKLDPRIDSPVISKSGDQIAYDIFDAASGTGEIRIADPKSDGYKKIMDTLFGGYQIKWIGNSTLSLLKPPANDSPNYWLFILDTKTGNLTRLLDSKPDLWILWSNDGQKFIYSYTDSTTQEKDLYFMNLSDLQEIKLTDASNISNCTWSIDNKTVYCARKDNFITIDTSAQNPSPQNVSTTFQGNISLFSDNASGLTLSGLENFLLFRKASDGKIYSLPLNP